MAGLAGGSSNAAGMIVALNELMETELSISELCDIGEKSGLMFHSVFQEEQQC